MYHSVVTHVAYHTAGKRDYLVADFTDHTARRAFRKVIAESPDFDLITIPCEFGKAVKLRHPEYMAELVAAMRGGRARHDG